MGNDDYGIIKSKTQLHTCSINLGLVITLHTVWFYSRADLGVKGVKSYRPYRVIFSSWARPPCLVVALVLGHGVRTPRLLPYS